MVPTDQVLNSDAYVFMTLWKDSAVVSLENSRLEVLFNNSCGGTARFESEGDFLFFQHIFEQNVPRHSPFEALGHDFVPRKSTAKPKQ